MPWRLVCIFCTRWSRRQEAGFCQSDEREISLMRGDLIWSQEPCGITCEPAAAASPAEHEVVFAVVPLMIDTWLKPDGANRRLGTTQTGQWRAQKLDLVWLELVWVDLVLQQQLCWIIIVNLKFWSFSCWHSVSRHLGRNELLPTEPNIALFTNHFYIRPSSHDEFSGNVSGKLSIIPVCVLAFLPARVKGVFVHGSVFRVSFSPVALQSNSTGRQLSWSSADSFPSLRKVLSMNRTIQCFGLSRCEQSISVWNSSHLLSSSVHM